MSGEKSWTPGPWAVHPANATVDAFNTGVPVPVCGMLWPTDERTEAETEANARLLAVAPKLFDVLEAIHRELVRQEINFGPLIADAEDALRSATDGDSHG